MLPPIRTLQKIAVYGGVIAVGGGLFFSNRIQEIVNKNSKFRNRFLNYLYNDTKPLYIANFRKQSFYQDSLKLLKGYPAVLHMIGEPVKLQPLELGDRKLNYTDGLAARLAIPLKGSNAKGVLHSWASRENTRDKWIIDKLDLEIGSQIWTFYINPDSRKDIKRTDLTEMNTLSETDLEQDLSETD